MFYCQNGIHDRRSILTPFQLLQFSQKTPEGVHVLLSANCVCEKSQVKHSTVNVQLIVDLCVVTCVYLTDTVEPLVVWPCFSLQTISSDSNAENLCAHYEPHVCLTRDALVRLLDNHGPEFGEQWELPVWVQLNPAKGTASSFGHSGCYGGS